MAELRKRLDVQVRAEYRDYIYAESDRTGRNLNAIADELLGIALAFKNGEIVEQQSLPVIREIVQTELRRTKAELRIEIREDMNLQIVHPLNEAIGKGINRVASLVSRALRDTGTIRRLVYTVLARAYGPEFAEDTFMDAREKASRELAPKPKQES